MVDLPRVARSNDFANCENGGTMKRPATVLIVALIAAKAPPRETGLIIPTVQSAPIVASCIEKRLHDYTESDIPGGGVSIKFGERRSLFIHYQPTLYFDLTEQNGNRQITVRYRHPMTKGTAAKMLRLVGRKCFPYELEAAGGGVLPDAG